MNAIRAVFVALVLAAVPFAVAAQPPPVQMPDFRALERQLRLKPSQKVQYDIAVLSLKRTLLASATVFLELKQQLGEELLKSRPDFTRLLSSQRAAFEMMAPLYNETMEEWARLYMLMTDDQVALARRFLEDALARLPRFE